MTPKIAFVFPGQGSQSVGMLKNIAADHDIIKKTFDEASAALGYDLWALSQAGPAEQLNQTEFTQPAILTASLALWRLWENERDNRPSLLAGHSLGEYTALVCAKSINFRDAVQLVALRGRLMQQAVSEGEGAMAAILGLDDATVEAVCEEARMSEKGVVSPANFNTPGQVVISGNLKPVLQAMEIAKARGAKKVIQLPVSVPSHCELMKPAAVALEQALNKIAFNIPEIPVIQNVDVAIHETPEAIRSALVLQLYKPVRWVETIQRMAEKGVDTVFECGPGSVLTGLNKRIVSTLKCQSLSTGEAVCL